MREALSGDLSASFRIDGGKAGRTLNDLKIAGRFEGVFRGRKSQNDRVGIELIANAENFSLAAANGTAIGDLDLHFPIQKTIYLGPSASKAQAPTAGTVWNKAYVQNLQSLSPYTNTVRAEKIVSAGYTLEKVQIDAGFDGTNFVVDRFAADFLDGSLWGRFTLLPVRNALKLSMAFEAVDLDMNRLLQPPLNGDARICADARADLEIRRGSKLSAEGVLDELQATFHLTKVGEQTLDRLILFLDPKGEDPSMVQARGLLKNKTVASALKNPRISFAVSHGNMNADIVLPGVSLVDLTIPIRGISVKNLLKLGGVRKSLEGLVPLIDMTRYLQLQGIDDSGNEIFAASTDSGVQAQR
jgi:hypothetical protein